MTVKSPRPISPHLQVYKLPLTAIISISHRVTGIVLFAVVLFVVVSLYVIMQGEATYLAFQLAAQGWFARLLFWGLLFALCFHTCHGLRHLIWDVGTGFDRAKLNHYATMELVAAVVLTLVIGLMV